MYMHKILMVMVLSLYMSPVFAIYDQLNQTITNHVTASIVKDSVHWLKTSSFGIPFFIGSAKHWSSEEYFIALNNIVAYSDCADDAKAVLTAIKDDLESRIYSIENFLENSWRSYFKNHWGKLLCGTCSAAVIVGAFYFYRHYKSLYWVKDSAINTMQTELDAVGRPAVYNEKVEHWGDYKKVTKTLGYINPFFSTKSEYLIFSEKLDNLWKLYMQRSGCIHSSGNAIGAALISLMTGYFSIAEFFRVQKEIKDDSKHLVAYKNMLATTQEVLMGRFPEGSK